MNSLFIRIDRALVSICRFALIFLVLSLAGMMAVGVFLRYVMDLSFPAMEELSIMVGLWFYFVSMAYVTRERAHLAGGILDLFDLTPQTRAAVKWIADFVGLGVICFFGFYTYKYLFFVMKINRVSTNLGWPTALWVGAAIVGFTLMAAYKLRDLFIHRNSYTVYDNKSPHSKDAVMEGVSR